MARNKADQTNIDLSNPSDYPDGRIKNNTGPGNGTPVNEVVYGDIHEMLAKLMRLYEIEYNGLPDNETNGYQLVEALVALASKNDFVLDLTSSSDILRVPLKLARLQDNESIILRATMDKGSETQIVGTLDNVNKAVTFLGDFKANEYVRMINTPTNVVLVRMIDSFNLDSAISDLSFLKAATQTEENNGAINTKATTPLTHLTAFVRRVIGADSGNYLAQPTSDPSPRNGLLSSADKEKIDNLADPASVIQVTSANFVQVSGWQGSSKTDNSSNFNFNYVDVFPPTGKTMADLAGFTASLSRMRWDGIVDDNDITWCNYQIQSTKVRVIGGSTELEAPARVNWLAIWI